MLTINNPLVQAQLQEDFTNGQVPAWNPNNREAAEAYVEYYNNLLDVTNVVQLEEVTTFKIKIVPQ